MSTFKFDMIFADSPYFLSNNGISAKNGKKVSVNKGDGQRRNYRIYQRIQSYRKKIKDLSFLSCQQIVCEDSLIDYGLPF